jgi:endonuclease III
MNSNNIDKVYSILAKEIPKYNVPVIDLIKVQTNDPFKVLIATILSARTKDSVTHLAAKRLFAKVKTFSDFNKYSQKQIEDLIYPVGFYKTKAKHLKELPLVMKQFNNKIPKDIDDLLKLPGVGRKTANLVQSVAFSIYSICVDTHVHKIMNRLGYIDTRTPLETEMRLRKILPKKYWTKTNFYFVALGQNICLPRNPKCTICPISRYCDKKIK